MKLYTEEQMAKVWTAGQKYWETSGASITFEELLEREKSIELPSDDDICDEAESIAHNYFVMQRNHYQGLEEGAKRMAYWLMKNFEQKDNEK